MSFISAIYLFGALQGFLLGIVLILKYKLRVNSKNFLTSFIFLLAGFLLYEFCVFERYIEIFPHLIGSFLPFIFMLAPLFYLYVKHETTPRNPNASIWPHLVPSLFVLFIMAPYYLSPAHDKLEQLFNHLHKGSLYPHREFLGIALLISSTIYGYYALKLTMQTKTVHAKWMKAFSVGFLLLALALMISMGLMKILVMQHRIIIGTGVIGFSFFIHFIGYAALMEPQLFTSPAILNRKKRAKFRDENIRQRIVQILQEEKKYRQSNFTLKDLSQLMDLNVNYLSAYINESFGCNFPYLINSYRITEAKQMILSKKYDHFNLLGIAMFVGFNNKNSFTRAFKRHTSQTPSAFKAQSSI